MLTFRWLENISPKHLEKCPGGKPKTRYIQLGDHRSSTIIHQPPESSLSGLDLAAARFHHVHFWPTSIRLMENNKNYQFTTTKRGLAMDLRDSINQSCRARITGQLNIADSGWNIPIITHLHKEEFRLYIYRCIDIDIDLSSPKLCRRFDTPSRSDLDFHWLLISHHFPPLNGHRQTHVSPGHGTGCCARCVEPRHSCCAKKINWFVGFCRTMAFSKRTWQGKIPIVWFYMYIAFVRD